jgi:hypothetical protein
MAKTHLIDQLGGAVELAAHLGAAPNAVANWRHRQIPWQWRPTIAALAETKGVALPEDFLSPTKAA